MSATAQVPVHADMAAIANAAGQPDPKQVFYSNGTLTVHGVTQSALDTAVSSTNQFALIQSRACNAVNQAAGAARSRYTTDAPGQDATYQLKSNEADAYIAAGRPTDTSPYPMLVSEAGATNQTVSALADAIQTKAAQWTQIAGQIEAARISNNATINALTAASTSNPTDAEVTAVTNAKNAAITALGKI